MSGQVKRPCRANLHSSPNHLMWSWPATDHEPRRRHVPITKFEGGLNLLHEVGRWRGHLAGIYSTRQNNNNASSSWHSPSKQEGKAQTSDCRMLCVCSVTSVRQSHRQRSLSEHRSVSVTTQPAQSPTKQQSTVTTHRLSLASFQGRLIEYQLQLGERAGMSPQPDGTRTCITAFFWDYPCELVTER